MSGHESSPFGCAAFLPSLLKPIHIAPCIQGRKLVIKQITEQLCSELYMQDDLSACVRDNPVLGHGGQQYGKGMGDRMMKGVVTSLVN